MKRPLLVLHGWSGKSEDFKPLSEYLKANGFNVVDIWLADYLSMNDEITIQDLGQAMGRALNDKKIRPKRHAFDVIVHSTGGLVIRQYLIHYFFGKPEKCPIRHLVMLAPANFGSPLAHLGKSMVGRLRSGWDWDHLFQTGTKVLDALELASPWTWKMAELDLFNPDNQIFKPENIFTTILIGSDSYPGMAGVLHENGSDGTVCVSTANLNSAYIKLDFGQEKGLEVEEIRNISDSIAFGVLYGHNHGSITRPADEKVLAELLLKSLAIESVADYKKHIKELNGISSSTFAKGIANPDKKESNKYHQYQHLVTRVHDQYNAPIHDYFMEFFQENGQDDSVTIQIQTEILEKVRKYSRDESYRSLMFDITDMKRLILDQGKRVDMSLCAAAVSDRIYYRDPREHITIAGENSKTFIRPNTTVFVDIKLPRIQAKEVFKFEKA